MKVMRGRHPSGFACMHVKSLIFDGKIVLDGSVNMTHNGYENNKEHMYRIIDPRVVSAVLADFEMDWSGAECVTKHDIDSMVARSDERARSQSKGRGTRRSPSRGEVDRACWKQIQEDYRSHSGSGEFRNYTD